jgi:hypothetical protein
VCVCVCVCVCVFIQKENQQSTPRDVKSLSRGIAKLAAHPTKVGELYSRGRGALVQTIRLEITRAP